VANKSNITPVSNALTDLSKAPQERCAPSLPWIPARTDISSMPVKKDDLI